LAVGPPSIVEEGLAMAKGSPWHSVKERIHHNNSNCNAGRAIEKRYRREGTGDKPLCEECARLY
jgi:hypothetical protein